jgi:hypothetical protein
MISLAVSHVESWYQIIAILCKNYQTRVGVKLS